MTRRAEVFAHFVTPRVGKRGTSHRLWWNHPTAGKQWSPWFKDREDALSMAAVVEARRGEVIARDRAGTMHGIRNGWDAAAVAAAIAETEHKDTLAYWHEKAIARSVRRQRSKQTITRYWAAHRQLAPFHSMPISSWTIDTSIVVQGKLANTVSARGKAYSPRAVNFAMNRIYAAIATARHDGFISVTPDNPLPLYEPEVGVSVSFDQSVALARAITDMQTRVFIGTQLLTSMRPGEVGALRVNDLKPGFIVMVDETLNNSVDRVGPPKTRKPRPVPVAPIAWENLAALAEGLEETDFLFSRNGGKRPPALETYEAYWNKAVTELAARGIVPATLRLHDMRHTAGSWLVDEGVPAVYAAQRQGHSLALFTRTYAHAGDAALEAMTHGVASRLALAGFTV